MAVVPESVYIGQNYIFHAISTFRLRADREIKTKTSKTRMCLEVNMGLPKAVPPPHTISAVQKTAMQDLITVIIAFVADFVNVFSGFDAKHISTTDDSTENAIPKEGG